MSYNINMTKLNYVETLRGVAILGVILIHSRLFVESSSPTLQTIVDNGDKGVQLFMVISGYVTCLAVKNQKLNTPRSIWEFYRKKFIRIIPAFYLAIVVYLVFIKYQPFSLLATLTTLSFTHGLFPNYINYVVPGGWYLATQMGFIILFPALSRYLKTAKSSWIAFLFIWATSRFVTRFLPQSEFFYYYLPAQLAIYILGMMSYHATQARALPRIILPSLIILVLVNLAHPTLVAPYVWFGIGFSIILYYLATFRPTWHLPLLTKLGHTSYLMYLFHYAVYVVFSPLHLATIPLFILVTITSYLASVLLTPILTNRPSSKEPSLVTNASTV